MPGTELFGAEERKEIDDVLQTGILFRYNHEAVRNDVYKAREMEAEVCKVIGSKYAHAVSSGSTAAQCAMVAAGIGAGDEVIVPPFTYVATVEAALMIGAIPVFAEIDETLCLSAAGLRKAITPKTKGVCLVHMCGQMAQMDEIMAVINEHNLVLVEDAGQAMGASYKGISTGLWGKTGAYSYDFFKIATAGEGGVIVTNDEHCYKMADSYSDHGHDHIGSNRGMEKHPIIGFNFRISELHAAVGLAQTRRIPYIVQKNNEHKRWLINRLSTVQGLGFATIPDPDGDSATFLNLLLPDTETAQRVVTEMTAAGVGGFNYWFTNMYHFINQWTHIKNMDTASKLAIEVLGGVQDYNNLELPKSQETVGRLISFGVRVTWTQAELEALANNIEVAVQKAVA